MRDGVVDVPAQLLQRHVGRLGGEIGDRAVAADSIAADLRLEDAVGQVAADLGDRVADVVDRAVDRRADLELDDGVAAALADASTVISSTPLTARTAASTRWVTWVSSSVGAAPGWMIETDDRREFDVRIVVHVHPHEADDAGQRQADEQDDRRNRVADRPGGDVAEIHRRLLPIGAGSARAWRFGRDLLAGIEEGAGRQHDPLVAVQAATMATPWSVTVADPDVAALDLVLGRRRRRRNCPARRSAPPICGSSGASVEPARISAAAKPPGRIVAVIGKRDAGVALAASADR